MYVPISERDCEPALKLKSCPDVLGPLFNECAKRGKFTQSWLRQGELGAAIVQRAIGQSLAETGASLIRQLASPDDAVGQPIGCFSRNSITYLAGTQL